MTKYLVEIGTEELPYKFIPAALEQLKELFNKALTENRIEFGAINYYGTPRRLTVIVDDISESQPDMVKEVKGPPAKVAFNDSGNLTQAGEGFLKKQNISKEAVYKKEVGGVEYLFAKIEEKGKTTAEVLQTVVPDLILKLQGAYFMRWANLDIKFSRPIRWMVSLLDENEVKIRIENIESSRVSRGHRFYERKEIQITNPDTYFEELRTAKVIVNQKEREAEIVNQAEKIASTVNGKARLNPELVKEVTYILEYPVPVLAGFDAKYLEIPDDVTVTVMASHQRYFPVYDSNGKLMNKFITMANYIGDNFDNIKAGNERVIKARLDDAIFFYREDNKKTLESRIEELKGVTFNKGLGSVYEKINRIREIAYFISTETELDKTTIENAERAAMLCKADLVTNLVFEFTELQGFIGSDYARLNGENTEVCAGIREHYFPLSADGELANSITGQVVGIADKIDTICGLFSIDKIPTGSADPLGLRRAALGCLLTIMNKNLKINLTSVIENAVSIQPVKIEDKAKLITSIKEFIIQRLKVYLTDGYKYDVVDAAMALKDPLANLNDLVERVKILSELVQKDDYTSFHEAVNRVSRIIKSQEYTLDVKPELFAQDAETQLWNAVKDINPENLSYNELLAKLNASIPAIEQFFDKVLVMDNDEQIRENRISLLGSLLNKFNKLGDFSKIVA